MKRYIWFFTTITAYLLEGSEDWTSQKATPLQHKTFCPDLRVFVLDEKISNPKREAAIASALIF